MSHLPFVLLAYFLNTIAVLADKFLLTKHIRNPLVYIFYFSVFSLLALIPLPFTHIPSLMVFILASLSTLFSISGVYFMYKALQIGQASRVIPVIGTTLSLLLLIEASLSHSINLTQGLAISLLIAGLIFLTISDLKGKASFKEFGLELLSASLFATAYLLIRQTYLREEFLTVWVWSRMVLIPVGLFILAVPSLRKTVLSSQKDPASPKFDFRSKIGALFLFGQACGGLSEILITFSISLATPALVNSLQGTQYVFLFIASMLLSSKFPQVFQRKLSVVYLIGQLLGILTIGGGLYLLAFA